MTAPRRLGATDSKSRALLLDAAEQLMLREGYAAVTSRARRGRGGHQAAARPLLLPHHGRPLCRGLPPPGRSEHCAVRERDGSAAHAANDLGVRDRPARRGVQHRVRCAREPPQGDPRRDRALRPTVPHDAARRHRHDPRRARHLGGGVPSRRGHARDDRRHAGNGARDGTRRDRRPFRDDRRSSSVGSTTRNATAPSATTHDARLRSGLLGRAVVGGSS